MQLPKIGSKLGSAMGSGLSSGLGSGSLGVVLGFVCSRIPRSVSGICSRLAKLGARLETQLGLAWPGSSSVGERTALSWVISARLRSVLTSIRLVSVRFSGFGSARL